MEGVNSIHDLGALLGGYVNKQNCRIGGSENPQIIVIRPFRRYNNIKVDEIS